MVTDVDVDDLAFVALNDQLNGYLVTGDLELVAGLIAKGYDKAITFSNMLSLINK